MAETLVIVALGLIVVAAVAYPLVAGRPTYDDDAALDADVARYRAALDAGTVCPRCRFANEPGSRFCAECGQALRAHGGLTGPSSRPRSRDAGTAPR